MNPYWKHVGFWLLLSSGVCVLASRFASLFGYNGRYALEFAAGCIACSLIFGAISHRLASRGAMEPHVYNRLTDPQTYDGLTDAQRRRLSLAWLCSAVVFGVLDFVVYQTTLHLFSDLMPRDLMPQMIIGIALAISGALTALFGIVFYRRVLPKIIPD